MTQDYLTKIKEITLKVRDLRVKLPDVTTQDVNLLSDNLTEIDFSKFDEKELPELNKAFQELSNEVTQVMHQLDQYCVDLQDGMRDVDTQMHAMKAYTKTQHAN